MASEPTSLVESLPGSGLTVPDTHRPHGTGQSALELTLWRLRPLLERADVTEICINRPREAYVESASGWHREALPWMDHDWCRSIVRLIANHATPRQRVDEQAPLLSAALPTGERVQIVMPPATSRDTVAITIRRPADQVWSIDELGARNVFCRTRPARSTLDDTERELLDLLHRQAHQAFLKLAVRARKNILVSGSTGSGKTTLTKALLLEIAPHERLITIEDAPELILDRHPNHVRLFHSRGDQGQAKVSARQLVQACLRMRPDRILLAELRGEEALDYLRNCNSGHPGSVTSIHAASAALAFEALVLLVQQSPGGDLNREAIKQLLYQTVDIVVQCGREQGQRAVTEIWYEPECKRRALQA